MSELIREFCAENMRLVPEAIRAGAGRVELCDNLAAGGTSPSYGVIRHAVEYAHEHGIAMMAMCRPRGGNFVYTYRERESLADDVRCARSLGVTGVVIGCLALGSDGKLVLDERLLQRLVEEAKGPGQGIAAGHDPVQVTFHMAFDELDSGRQSEAIDTLAGLGIERILTHGGPLSTPIEENLAHLAELVAYANGRLSILPGGGITWQNAKSVAQTLGVREVHGSRIVRLSESAT